jgi:formylglycine-generating enzyme
VIRPFYIGRTPVSIELYHKFCTSVGRQIPKSECALSHLDLPVSNISWLDSVAFCDWFGCRLPTSDEWEWVARSGCPNLYPWGNDPPSPKFANYSGVFGKPTTPGHFSGSVWMVLDLAGNVLEWMADRYIDERKLKEGGDLRIVRGGAWNLNEGTLCCAWFDALPFDIAFNNTGFRLALDADY